MKKIIFSGLNFIYIIGAMIIFSSCQAEKKEYIFSSGSLNGSYYAIGNAISEIIEKTNDDLDIKVISSEGSFDNILMFKDGEADFAFLQNDIMDYYYNGTQLSIDGYTGFSAIGSLYPEVVHIITTTDIKSMSDLIGKRVSVSQENSGTLINAQQILDEYVISFDDM